MTGRRRSHPSTRRNGRRRSHGSRGEQRDGAKPRSKKADTIGREVLDRLKELATKRRSSLILTHDNPDPDSMAAAYGMAFLFEKLAGLKKHHIAYGGIIGRAENRALVRHLKLPMIPISRVNIDSFDLVTLVDTQHPAGNHSLPRARAPDIVIDHHPLRPANQAKSITLVSDTYGSTSSIVTQLIRLADLEPDRILATALFYGVKSDTRSLGRSSIPADTEIYRWLFQRADQLLLSRVEHPQVPLSYFQAYHRAYERARVYKDVIMVDLGGVYTPDIVPEIAERLLSLENVKWSVATGIWESELYVSVRTNDRRRNAGRHIQALTRDLGGSAGGHGSMAGARIPLRGDEGDGAHGLRDEIMSRFRKSLGVDRAEGNPIVEQV